MDAYNQWNHIPQRIRFFDLSADEWELFHDGVANLAKERGRVEKVGGVARGDFLVFNEHGALPAIHWCYNNWGEPLLLARQLASDQPLYSMHSVHGFSEKWRIKTRFHEHLVTRYLEYLERAGNIREPMIIGGNCQGAPVAESLAIRIYEQLDISPLLITLDYVPRRKYTGTMVMLFGKNSMFNPFNTDIDPLPIWRSNHGDFGWGILNASHGQYFREPAIIQLKYFIELAIDKFIAKERFESKRIVGSLVCDITSLNKSATHN